MTIDLVPGIAITSKPIDVIRHRVDFSESTFLEDRNKADSVKLEHTYMISAAVLRFKGFSLLTLD